MKEINNIKEVPPGTYIYLPGKSSINYYAEVISLEEYLDFNEPIQKGFKNIIYFKQLAHENDRYGFIQLHLDDDKSTKEMLAPKIVSKEQIQGNLDNIIGRAKILKTYFQ
ncbi:hypothetical protein ACFL1H_00340 [Nanoarchaeota archaeon]